MALGYKINQGKIIDKEEIPKGGKGSWCFVTDTGSLGSFVHSLQIPPEDKLSGPLGIVKNL